MNASATKHTPGPWAVVDGARGPRQAGAWICTIGNNPGDPGVFSLVLDDNKFVFGDKVADAHLIAAAPTMLAALKAVLAHKPDHADAIWEQVEEAIAATQPA